jgi:hypothetical protein
VKLIDRLVLNRHRAALILALLAVAGLPLHLAIKDGAAGDLLPVGGKAPVLQGPTVAGGYYDSVRDSGRLRVFAFVDPTAAAGAKQAQVLNMWREHFADEDEGVVFVAVLTGGELADGQRFALQHNLPAEDVVLDKGETRAGPWRAGNPPVVYVVDPTGLVQFAARGPVNPSDSALMRAIRDYRPTVRLSPRKQ